MKEVMDESPNYYLVCPCQFFLLLSFLRIDKTFSIKELVVGGLRSVAVLVVVTSLSQKLSFADLNLLSASNEVHFGRGSMSSC